MIVIKITEMMVIIINNNNNNNNKTECKFHHPSHLIEYPVL